MMDYRRAAELMPRLSAMYGHKRTVGGYKYGQVLLELLEDSDSSRFSMRTQEAYGKIKEAKAKAKRRGK